MSIATPAPAALADAAHIQVLLVGIGHYPHLADLDLMGTQGDVELWHGLFKRMGIPSENMWLAASPIADAAEESQTVSHLLSTLPAGQVAPDGTRAGIEALLKAFVGRLSDPASKADRALVFWAGHGHTAPDGTLSLATADTAEVGGGPLESGGSYTGLLAWNDLADLLDRRPQSVGLTLVLDTCFAAAGPGHRSLTATTPKGGRALPRAVRGADVVLSASLGGQQALEVAMHKLQVGAFSWAATCVLGRWGQSQQQAGMDISLNSLVARAGALLFAADILQTPAFDGPADQGQRPFLHPPQDVRVGDSAPQDLPGSEIHPGNGGLVYTVTDLSGGALSPAVQIVVTPHFSLPTTTFSTLTSKRIWWSSLPSADFKLDSSRATAITPSGGTTYKTSSYTADPKPGPGTVSGWEIRVTSGGSIKGYLYQSGSSLIFLRVTTGAAFNVGSTFTFKSSLDLSGNYYEATDHLA